MARDMCDSQHEEAKRQQQKDVKKQWYSPRYQKVRWIPWSGMRPIWEFLEAATLGLPYGLVASTLSMIYLFVFQYYIYPGPRMSDFSGDESSVEVKTTPNHLDSLRGPWNSAYPFQAFATLMSFLVVFRCVVTDVTLYAAN